MRVIWLAKPACICLNSIVFDQSFGFGISAGEIQRMVKCDSLEIVCLWFENDNGFHELLVFSARILVEQIALNNRYSLLKTTVILSDRILGFST